MTEVVSAVSDNGVPASRSDDAVPSRGPSKTLLLVEDNLRDARRVLETLNGSESEWAVVHVSTVRDAIGFLVSHSAACALVDARLADPSGLDAISELRLIASELPIIVLTSPGDNELGPGAVRAGAQDFLPKFGIHPEVLNRTIVHALERGRLEAQLAHQALHDPLTGLPNRPLFLDRLAQALARWQRHGSLVTVMYLDLDRFKAVNDALGHEIGDRLLITVAERLKRVLRPSDVMARFGGDEFVALCEDLTDERDATIIAQRIVEAIAEPFEFDGQEAFVTTSVGIAIAASPLDTPETLLRDADTAMYRAKERGKHRYEIFDEQLRERIQVRLDTEGALRRAIERNEFVLYYQPLVNVDTEKVVGLEALVRWNHPDKGILAPGLFIPLAEETGMIVQIGGWVLGEACRQLKELQTTYDLGHDLKVSVNMSAAQLAEAELLDMVSAALAESGLNPKSLNLEITESILMETETATKTLENLKGLGVELSIDDFGTGYSSLAYLKRYPVNALKVDRSFVDGLGQDDDDSAIVSAVISMARALGLATVAEGVETLEQLQELRGLKSDFAQGFYFAKPQPFDQLVEYLKSKALPA